MSYHGSFAAFLALLHLFWFNNGNSFKRDWKNPDNSGWEKCGSGFFRDRNGTGFGLVEIFGIFATPSDKVFHEAAS